MVAWEAHHARPVYSWLVGKNAISGQSAYSILEVFKDLPVNSAPIDSSDTHHAVRSGGGGRSVDYLGRIYTGVRIREEAASTLTKEAKACCPHQLG